MRKATKRLEVSEPIVRWLGPTVLPTPIASGFALLLGRDFQIQYPPHVRIMTALARHIDEMNFVRWTVKGSDLPLHWDDALRRLSLRRNSFRYHSRRHTLSGTRVFCHRVPIRPSVRIAQQLLAHKTDLPSSKSLESPSLACFSRRASSAWPGICYNSSKNEPRLSWARGKRNRSSKGQRGIG